MTDLRREKAGENPDSYDFFFVFDVIFIPRNSMPKQFLSRALSFHSVYICKSNIIYYSVFVFMVRDAYIF